MEKLLPLLPWLVMSAILLIPVLCIVLYRCRQLRACLVFSHLWCICAACVLAVILIGHLRRPSERRDYAYKTHRLLAISRSLREGKVQESIEGLDEFLAGTLYRTAYDVPDDQMAGLDPYTLEAWQQVKEYFDAHAIGPAGGMIYHVIRKLEYVPWSEMQVAVRKYEKVYQSGEKALAPAINMKSWLGGPLSGEKLKGKVILLDFWNTHCGPCIKSFPEVQKLHDTYKEKGLVVITCAQDKPGDAKAFLDKHGYSVPTGIVSKQMILDYAVRGNPSYYLIDRQGYLAWGPEHRLPTEEELTTMLETGQAM